MQNQGQGVHGFATLPADIATNKTGIATNVTDIAALEAVIAWKQHAELSPVGAASIEFTGLGGYFYEVNFVFTITSEVRVTFNGDAGANYNNQWVNTGRDNNANVDVQGSEAAAAYFAVVSLTAVSKLFGRIRFHQDPADSAHALAEWKVFGYDSNSNMALYSGSCSYTGAAAVSSVQMYPAAGTLTGDANIMVVKSLV